MGSRKGIVSLLFPSPERERGQASRRQPLDGPVGPGRAVGDRASRSSCLVNRRDCRRARVRPVQRQRHRHGLGHWPPRRPGQFGDREAPGVDEVLLASIGTYRTATSSTQLVNVKRSQLWDTVEGKKAEGPEVWLETQG